MTIASVDKVSMPFPFESQGNLAMSRKFSLACSAATIGLYSALLIGCSDKSSQQYLDSAHRALENGDRSTAMIDVKNALQKDPKSGDAHFLMAQLLFESGDVSGSEIELGKVEGTGYAPDRVTALRARLLLARGQGGKVLSSFAGTQLASSSAMADLLASLAAASEQTGNLQEALTRADASIKLVPNDKRAQLIKARVLSKASRFDEAQQIIDSAVASFGSDAEVWRGKGDLLIGAGKTDDAVIAYRKAVSLDKKDLASRAALFSLAMQKSDLAAAKVELEGMQSIAAKSPQTLYFTSLLAFENKQLKEAHEAIEAVLKVAPEDPRALLLAGRIDFSRGAFLEAEANLYKIISSHPREDGVRALLAQVQLHQGDPTKALATLQPTLIDEDKHPAVFGVAAEAYMRLGDLRQAEVYFAKAAKANPSDTRSRIALALADVRQGRLEQGMAKLQSLASGDGGVAANLALINLHLQRKAYTEAIAAIGAMQRQMPDSALPDQLRGRAALLQGDAGTARTAFEAALKREPGNYPVLAELLRLDLANKDIKAGEMRLRKFLEAQPKHVAANMALVNMRVQAGATPEEVASALSKLVEQLPNEPAPRLALVDVQLRRKDVKAALSTAQNAAAALPENAEIQESLGRTQAASGNYSQAMAAFNKQISLKPNSPQVYLPIAELYASRNDNAAAAKSLNRALAVAPNFVPAQVALITLDINTGKYDDARRVARTVLTQRPKESVGAAMMGEIEFSQRNWAAAAAAYRSALGLLPSTEVALKLHQSLYRSGGAAAAAEFEKEWLSARGGDVRFMLYLGDDALSRKDYTRSERWYREVLRENPSNPIALNNMAWLLAQTNQSEALKYAELANKAAPDQPGFLDTLAEVYSKGNQWDKAVETQKKVVSLAPEKLGYRLKLARYYIAFGQKDAAKRELTRLAGLSEKLPEQQAAKKLLATL